MPIARIEYQDLQSGNAESLRTFIDSLIQYGYVLLRGHGISSDLFQATQRAMEGVFALPEARKRSYVGANGLVGYLLGDPNERYTADRPPAEFWQIAHERPVDATPRDKMIPANPWPEDLPDFKAATKELSRQLDDRAFTCIRAIGLALGEGIDILSPLCAGGLGLLRLIAYPAPAAGMPPDVFRSTAHTDASLLTLYTGGSTDGLEVQLPDGSWSPIAAGTEELLVGAGETLTRLTNGLVPAIVHRVIYRPDDRAARHTTPFFRCPRSDVLVEPLPACVRRTGGISRYPSRPFSAFLAERSGWTDDPAVEIFRQSREARGLVQVSTDSMDQSRPQ